MNCLPETYDPRNTSFPQIKKKKVYYLKIQKLELKKKITEHTFD
jgi:hypothetical protein